MCVALDKPINNVKCNKYRFILQITFFVANIFVAPIWEAALKRNEKITHTFENYPFFLKCDDDWIYPTRFLYIWVSDFFCALISIITVLCEKSSTSDQERLKIARKLDINNMTDNLVKKTKE